MVCARHIPSKDNPPDTYVKCYLRDGERWLQKKKTRVYRHSCEPQFRQTLKYQACDVLGRSLVSECFICLYLTSYNNNFIRWWCFGLAKAASSTTKASEARKSRWTRYRWLISAGVGTPCSRSTRWAATRTIRLDHAEETRRTRRTERHFLLSLVICILAWVSVMKENWTVVFKYKNARNFQFQNSTIYTVQPLTWNYSTVGWTNVKAFVDFSLRLAMSLYFITYKVDY